MANENKQAYNLRMAHVAWDWGRESESGTDYTQISQL